MSLFLWAAALSLLHLPLAEYANESLSILCHPLWLEIRSDLDPGSVNDQRSAGGRTSPTFVSVSGSAFLSFLYFGLSERATCTTTHGTNWTARLFYPLFQTSVPNILCLTSPQTH